MANTPDSIRSKIGAEIGVSDWLEITQAMIDSFADISQDHQFIHVDPVAAASTIYGGTVAHGFFILSLLPKLAEQADFHMAGATMGVNYGFDRIRFLEPVRAGKRIRARFVLKDMQERSPGLWQSTLATTVEIEGGSKPSLIADWLGVQFVAAGAPAQD